MNIILVESQSDLVELTAEDARTQHIRGTLRLGLGEPLYVGVPQGPRGYAKIIRDDAQGMALEVEWETHVPPLCPLEWILGLPRPQTAKKLLEAGASLGVQKITFFDAEKGEPAYAESSLWKEERWMEHLKLGAEQAFATTFPELVRAPSLAEVMASIPSRSSCIALDVYEANAPLGSVALEGKPCVLALGPERGWSADERSILRKHGFSLAHLGERVLRCETAAVAASGAILSKWIDG